VFVTTCIEKHFTWPSKKRVIAAA